MGKRLRLRAGTLELVVILNESTVATAVAAAAPFEATCQVWGEEIYFATPVPEAVGQSEARRETVAAGEVAYWPPGQALCLFWGPTPLSRPGEIRPASPVAPVGWLEGEPGWPAGLAAGQTVTVTLDREQADEVTQA